MLWTIPRLSTKMEEIVCFLLMRRIPVAFNGAQNNRFLLDGGWQVRRTHLQLYAYPRESHGYRVSDFYRERSVQWLALSMYAVLLRRGAWFRMARADILM